MPYNGSGTYTTTNPPPFVFNTTISEAQMNAALADIANALSAVVVRDGQGAMTGPLNMGSQVITNIAAGTAAAPSVRFTAGNGLYMPGADQVGVAILGTLVTNFSAGAQTTYGQLVPVKNAQTTYSTGAIEARSADGDVHIGLHAAGATATSIRHTRGGAGISIMDAIGTSYAPIVASTATFGSQLMFRAYRSTSLQSGSDIIFDGEVADPNNAYNNSTGVFTAPVDGPYLFTVSIGFANLIGSPQSVSVQFHTTPDDQAALHTAYIQTTSAYISFPCLIKLTAGQQAYVNSHVSFSGSLYISGGAVSSSPTKFAGYLLP